MHQHFLFRLDKIIGIFFFVIVIIYYSDAILWMDNIYRWYLIIIFIIFGLETLNNSDNLVRAAGAKELIIPDHSRI